MKKGLWEAVNGSKGTARAVCIEGVEISGKTGTAQVVGRKENDITSEMDRPVHLKAHAWFVSYAPSDDPRIAVAVIVEHGGHGSSTAAPMAREIINSYVFPDTKL